MAIYAEYARTELQRAWIYENEVVSIIQFFNIETKPGDESWWNVYLWGGTLRKSKRLSGIYWKYKLRVEAIRRYVW